ncbi:MAG: rhomboid family intramembrane serine protease [Chloroflexi bacterium]|nr:rhomboid family intramembrane serine protease [Chloroflexota bacterium]
MSEQFNGMNSTPVENISSEPANFSPEPEGRIHLKFESNRPIVTYLLVGVTLLFFLFQTISQFIWGYDLPALIGLKSNKLILQGELWRLFTPVLLHGGLLHIFFNMYALFSIGREIELFYGHWRYLALYVVSAFAGNVFSFLFTAAPSLGASTAIFGLIGAQALFIYQNRKFFKNSRAMLTNTFVVIAINLFVIGSLQFVDNFGHLGGLLGGALFAWLAGPIWVPSGVFPVIEISDRRKNSLTLPVALGVFMLFALVAASKFIIK